MVMRFSLLIALFSLILRSVGAEPINIVLAGDSTVATQLSPPKDRPTLAGWGQMLGKFMPQAIVVNHARSGTSTKSFRAVGLWDRVLNEKPDWVFMQFGHNDQKKDPMRATDADTTYRDNLRTFIREVRERGAKPVIVTSVARRVYVDGKLTTSLTSYVDAAKAVGAELKVPVVDLHHSSFALFEQLGEKFCKMYGPSDKDLSHFSQEGARMMARLVAEGLEREVPELRPLLQLQPPSPVGLPYDVKLTTVTKGYDGKTCWVHPRAGTIPGKTPSVVLTMQQLLLSGSDVFYALNDTRSDDLGGTWSAIREHSDTLQRRNEPNGVEVCPSDFTPKYHAKSGKLLGIGHNVRYRDNKVMHDRQRETVWSVYDEKTQKWSPWAELKMPADAKFFCAGAGCVQRFDLENGDILLPIYFKAEKDKYYRVTVLRCSFDGTDLKYVEHGTELALESGRGVYEPSLTRCAGRFYLTLRNDTAGYVSVSEDGLHFGTIQPWKFDDGSDLGNYNTQQHWVTHRDRLFLVYNRRGAQNDHVIRHRAPLLMAEVDKKNLAVLRRTECILIPERGARLGNFGVTEVSENETWVTVAEWMQTHSPHIIIRPDNAFKADNSVYAARILWKD
jgi:lysophospholipase L1-like esterase